MFSGDRIGRVRGINVKAENMKALPYPRSGVNAHLNSKFNVTDFPEHWNPTLNARGILPPVIYCLDCGKHCFMQNVETFDHFHV